VALEVLRAHGIIHGDIKMENVLVYWDEVKYATAKVSDFCHSVFHLAAEESASYIGTPIYKSPGRFTSCKWGYIRAYECESASLKKIGNFLLNRGFI
jgi:serine/threonine protein kinase